MQKYVIFKNTEGRERAIVFPSYGTHSVMAARHIDNDEYIVAAGFAQKDEGVWYTFGTSITLNIGSRPGDEDVLKNNGTVLER